MQGLLLRLAAHAMATRFELVLHGAEWDRRRLRAIGEEALREIYEWDARLSRFAPDSELSFINRTAAARPVRLDEDVFSLLSLCLDVRAKSAGAFDPTVALAMDALRTGAAGLPGAAGMRLAAGTVHLDAAKRTVQFEGEGVQLDLGGVAKGFALDRAARVLRESGIQRALLHGGTSSIIAIGRPGAGEEEGSPGWGVSVPGEIAEDGTADSIVFELEDEAMSVSAPRGRMLERHGIRCGHIVDPATGDPVGCGATAAVIAASAAAADAWSTAAVVHGRRPAGMDQGYGSALHEPRSGWRLEGRALLRARNKPRMEVL